MREMIAPTLFSSHLIDLKAEKTHIVWNLADFPLLVVESKSENSNDFLDFPRAFNKHTVRLQFQLSSESLSYEVGRIYTGR